MYKVNRKVVPVTIALLMVCVTGCGNNSNISTNESSISTEIWANTVVETSENAVPKTSENAVQSTELNIDLPDDYVPLYLNDDTLQLFNSSEDEGVNIYSYNLDNFVMCKQDMFFVSENEDIDSDYIVYSLDGDRLTEIEHESFDFALNYDRFYSLDTELPEDAYIDKLLMDTYRYGEKELYCYTDSNHMTFFAEKIDEDNLLVCHQGNGWAKDYYIYDISNGSIKDIFKELGTPDSSVAAASFSDDLGSVLFSSDEYGDFVYYYADLEKNEYVKVNEVFDIDVNYFDSNGLAHETEFLWVEDDIYMIVVPNDNGFNIYKCNFADRSMEVIEENLAFAHVVRCSDGEHGDCIIKADENGTMTVERPAEQKDVVLKNTVSKAEYSVYKFAYYECNDIIALDDGGSALIIDWDNEATMVKNTGIKDSNFVREGNNIYVFKNCD